jgi:predicted lipoprotein with Yx(FWY)xxD motif
MSRIAHGLCLLALLAFALAGCGGGEDSASDEGTTVAKAPPAASTPPSEADDRPEKGAWGVAFGAEGQPFGIIIYDLSGHTLYTFSKDVGGKSSCYGACAKVWLPALTEGKPRAGGAAVPGKVGATKRRDGTTQLTYAGHPLYRYSRDKSAEVSGHGRESFGGRWFAIRPNGEKP